MIPYVEIIDKYTIRSFALVEPSQCWFELSYYDMGEFEIYAPATLNNINSLKMGNYVKIPNKPFVWIIKSIQYTFNSEGGRMIDAKGFEAKWIISLRAILSAWQLPADLTNAVHQLFRRNIGNGAVANRQINFFKYTRADALGTIESTQATLGNLWEFMANLLKSNKCGSYTTYEYDLIYFTPIKGRDLSSSIKFSQSLDNLISSEYYSSSENKKSFCRVVSTFNEKVNDEDVVNTYIMDCDLGTEGIDRQEIVVNSNLQTKMDDGTEILPSSETYQQMQYQEGLNKLAEHYTLVEFNGEIDLEFSHYQFVDRETQAKMEEENQDTTNCFFLGDIVGIRDEYFGINATARILKYTFKQDESGYGEEAEYGDE